MTKALMKAGADIHIPNDKLQYPLHIAAFHQHEAVVCTLLEHENVNLNFLDQKGRTAAEDTSNAAIRDLILHKKKFVL